MTKVSLRAAAGLAAIATLASGAAAARADDQGPTPAHVWLTTPDRTQLLADKGTVPFVKETPPNFSIAVDPTTAFQTIDGFGASITDSSAVVLYRLDPAARDQVMKDLFDPATGLGLSFLRQPMGASDFFDSTATGGVPYSYDDMPAGATDYDMAHFSIAHDEPEIIPLVQRANQLNPGLKILGTPWGQPAWMKTNQSMIGGRLIDDPRIYKAYAQYFVKYVQAYAAHGIHIDYLSIQNEPQNRTPSGYPGTDLPEAQAIKVINELGPALQAAGLDTKILAYDHNWSEHPNDIASAQAMGVDPEVNYPYDMLRSSAAQWIYGTAYHHYSGVPAAQSALHDAFPDHGIWMTEATATGSSNLGSTFSSTLQNHSQNLVIGNLRNWGRSLVNWNLALDDQFGPHFNGCSNCIGVVTVNADKSVYRDPDYYELGQLSRFVKQGAIRIDSTSGGSNQVQSVAFRNPDGSTAVVLWNSSRNTARPVSVNVNGWSADYTLPGGALATFVWGDNVASGPVGGTVPATLSLSLTSPSASFGTFVPGVARDYTATLAANVISTAGDATLSVADPSTTATGHLVNGAFSLPSPLQATAAGAPSPGGAFAPLAADGGPLALLTYAGPVSNDAVTISFKQTIGATDALRTGNYGKSLVFTLSTTTP
jgi:glucosylceramidase